jgi:RHS repeat-associated protein
MHNDALIGYLSNENETPVEVYFDDFKVEHIKSPVIQMDDYYPFGLAFNSYSRENSVPQNFKFNGIEQQNDLNLGVYSAFYRMYDPAIGRWWQVDPKPSLQESLYLGMDGNPVLRPDPLGDKVRYERGEGVTREQHREFKREIRQMRRDSDSFGKMHKDLRKDKSTFVYKSESKSVSSSGALGKTEQKDGKTYMSVNVNSSAEGSKSATQISGIAHETGHGWRQLQGLDGPEPTLTGTDRASMNSYIDAFAQHHESSERGATHIENIVKSELMRSGNSSYDGISLRSEYSPGFKSVMSFDANMQMQKTLKVTTYNVLEPPRDANYYNRTIDIHQEHGVQPIE